MSDPFWWVVFLFLLGQAGTSASCSTPSLSQDPPREPSQSEDPLITRPKAKDFCQAQHPDDLCYPPGTFQWQPQGRHVVVHTGNRARYYWINRQKIQPSRFGFTGLEMEVWTKPAIKHHRVHDVPKWIGIDVPSLFPDGALHLFECTARPNSIPRQSHGGPFVWVLTPEFYADCGSNSTLTFYMLHHSGPGRVHRGEPSEAFPQGEPRMEEAYLKLAYRHAETHRFYKETDATDGVITYPIYAHYPSLKEGHAFVGWSVYSGQYINGPPRIHIGPIKPGDSP